MTDSNSDGIVDTLDNRGTLYTKAQTQDIDEAQEGWKEDWESAWKLMKS